MDEEMIKRFTEVLSSWCWCHDFRDFRAAAGFSAEYGENKWRDLQRLSESLASFDPATLARILAYRRPGQRKGE